ncbi:LAQU0S07e01024g1_1 [Lachancea quebecensis]|uniref:LAQU0S07e01024g1_1 n=1 Tax=Lachancea quebecensis TaxID=1654605 RepID=A0A0P1KRM8_9SACH|nr:LAQU0S07e01024g1_1 [Lachancea quebecensis]
MDEEELQLKRELKEKKTQELARRKRARDSIERKEDTKRPVKNCAIYISHLPLEVTKDEVVKEFTKYGVIRKDSKSSEPKCKFYYDDDGCFEGAALIVYMRPESVRMAIDLMDGYNFMGRELKVEEATFKKEPKNDTKGSTDSPKSFNGGSAEPELNNIHSEVLSEQQRELQDRGYKSDEKNTAQEEEDEPDSDSSESESSPACTVVLANVLDLYANLGSQQIAEIAADLKEGCETIGSVVSFDLDEVLGQAKIEYKSSEVADKCCQLMNGRFFDGRKLIAFNMAQAENEEEDEVSDW